MSDDERFMPVRGSVAQELTEPEVGQMATKKYIYTVVQEMIHKRDPHFQDMVQREVRAAVDATHRYKDVKAQTSNHPDPPNAPKRRRTEERSQSPTADYFPYVSFNHQGRSGSEAANVAPSTPPRKTMIASSIEDPNVRGHPSPSLRLPVNDISRKPWDFLSQRKQEWTSCSQQWKPWWQLGQKWHDVKSQYSTGGNFQNYWTSPKAAWNQGNQKGRYDHTKPWGFKDNWQTSNGWYYKSSDGQKYWKSRTWDWN